MTTISFKGKHFQQDMILQSIRWYLAYALSYLDIEEIMKEHGFDVDHSSIQRPSNSTIKKKERGSKSGNANT